jgi:geranylgeranyl diphosphate synthase type I
MADRPVAEPSIASRSLDAVRELVDAEIAAFLAERRAELATMDPAAPALVDEISRLLGAGGKRIRPALCYWAHLAAGGPGDAAIARAASAVELLHTFALIHDDVMDAADARRGVATTHAAFAARAPAGTDPGRFGMAAAILVGDLCAVLAEWMLRTCGAEPGRLALATERFDHMRMAMAAGQLLDVGSAGSPIPRSPVAALKTGSYTGEGPILVATALAGAGPATEGPLRA